MNAMILVRNISHDGISKGHGRKTAMTIACRTAALALVGLFLVSTIAAQEADSASLYHSLQTDPLDAAAVYEVRDREIALPHARISLERGTIAFTTEIDGRVTGAMFEGEGEVLVSPPSDRALRQAERESLALFTGSAILDERFTSAYFRFSDDAPFAWRTHAPTAAEKLGFLQTWKGPAVELASGGALPLFTAIRNGNTRADWGPTYFMARFSGGKAGTFTLRLNGETVEQFSLSQIATANGNAYENIWMRFPIAPAPPEAVRITDYDIHTVVTPPTSIQATAKLTLHAQRAGVRAVVLQLSHQLKVQSAISDGQGLEVIQEEATAGSARARGGDDVVTLVFPRPLPVDAPISLTMTYGGPVLADAGNGLIYVGARGIWYPSRGPELANFDLHFDCPAEWTLLATGDLQPESQPGASHWKTSRPIPLAGFNLGQYQMGSADLPGTTVAAYATRGMENLPEGKDTKDRRLALPGMRSDPARHVQQLALRTQESVLGLQERLGPFPFAGLRVTQQPGDSGQGWPGLIYLSSLAYVDPDEIPIARRDPYAHALYAHLMLSHEVAHQWFGDSIVAEGDRDAWLIEALANESALLVMEKIHPHDSRDALEHYRESLLQRKSAEPAAPELRQAGAVTLGFRLSSSQFPYGFDSVAYGRGTWLMHMLRALLRDPHSQDPDAAFVAALRELLASPQRTVSNRDLQRVMESRLPVGARYEGRRSLDWFTEGWVNGTAVPRLALKGIAFQTRKNAARTASGTILQTEAPNWLVTPVPLFANVEGQDDPVFLAWIFAEGPETQFRLPVPPGTTELVLDANNAVLRRK
jgi:peptidase M1-like protein